MLDKLSDNIGLGLRHAHYQDILKPGIPISWFEIHAENFMVDGGPALDFLTMVREQYNLSIHGIGLSLGSVDGIDIDHLKRFKTLIDITNPFLVSEHLSWSKYNNVNIPDLLPVPYNKQSLSNIINNIDFVQNYLQREILIENPSSYIEFMSSDIKEYEFLNELIKATGAYILLDLNNIYVSCNNNNWDIQEYLCNVNIERVKEVHLAGHAEKIIGQSKILIDDHSSKVPNVVWDLYKDFITRKDDFCTLIEWDNNLPSFNDLLNEARTANDILLTVKHQQYERVD